MNDKPLAFPPSTLPIIGQRVELKSWFPTALITCHCGEHTEPILLVGLTPSPCVRCQRSYVIGEVHHVHGQPPKIVIGIVTGTGVPS